MDTTRGGIGTLYKESFKFVDLDEDLRALGFKPAQITDMRVDALEHGHSFFVIPTQDGIAFAATNRVRLMMRGIDTETLLSEENKFEVGDTVTLNSGGQVMTVSKINDDTVSADLIWNNVCSCGFGSMFRVPLACLVPANPPA